MPSSSPPLSAHEPSPPSFAATEAHDQASLACSSNATNAALTATNLLIPPCLRPPPAIIDATPYRIPPPLPAAAYYLPSFITAREEADIIAAISAAPARRWVHLARRRLQTYPCPITEKGTLVVSSAQDLQLPVWMEGVLERLSRVRLPGGRGVFAEEKSSSGAEHERGGEGGKGRIDGVGDATAARRPNHCLVNEYRPGQGINMHEDGPAYISVVATVTLGSYGVLDIVHKDRRHASSSFAPAAGAAAAPWRILQERRSLLISTADVYTQCLHGIESTERDVDLFGRQDDAEKRVVNAELLGAGGAGSGRRSSNGSIIAEEEGGDTFDAGIGVRGTRLSLTFRFVRKTKTVGRVLGQRIGGGGAGR